MKFIKRLFKRKKDEVSEVSEKHNPIIYIKKPFCAKPIGHICFGNETNDKCGCCGHWIK